MTCYRTYPFSVQSHSHSPKNLASVLPSGREFSLACQVIASQVKWCDCPE